MRRHPALTSSARKVANRVRHHLRRSFRVRGDPGRDARTSWCGRWSRRLPPGAKWPIRALQCGAEIKLRERGGRDTTSPAALCLDNAGEIEYNVGAQKQGATAGNRNSRGDIDQSTLLTSAGVDPSCRQGCHRHQNWLKKCFLCCTNRMQLHILYLGYSLTRRVCFSVHSWGIKDALYDNPG